MKNISRSGGGKAIASSAYRSGEKLRDNMSGISYDYTRRSGVVYADVIAPYGAPEWARSRESLWNEAEAAEKRKDARVAREIEVALPRELTLEQQIRLVTKYAADSFVSDGMAADICVHDKGDGNPHAHIMLTTREVTEAGWGSKGKESKNQTSWNRQDTLERWRAAWEAETNAALEMAGIDGRVDRRTLKEQGVGRMPQIHVGAYSNAMPSSDRKVVNEEIKRLNAEREAVTRDMAGLDRQLAGLRLEMQAAMLGLGAGLEHDTAGRLDRRIAELDYKLNNPPYWIGSAGYPEREAAADARELLKLESMRLYDESEGEISQQDALKEAVERHPVVADIERRLERSRGQGR
jgi:hypothetical protein